MPVLCFCEKGLFTFQNGKVSKLKYQDPPMTFRPHGVTVSAELDGKEIIFATSQPMTTDRAGCFIGVVKIVDGKVSEFAGSAHLGVKMTPCILWWATERQRIAGS